jgi:hypothetical protein
MVSMRDLVEIAREPLTRANSRRQPSARYRQASDRVGDVVDGLAEKGYGVRDDVAGAVARGAHEVGRSARSVARGAHEVENFATAVQGDRG